MNEQNLGRLLLGLPLDALLQTLGLIAKYLSGNRLAAFLKEAGLAGYRLAGHEDAQTALIEAHGISSRKMRDAAERRRRRKEEEGRRRQEEEERQRRLEAFWRRHHPDQGPADKSAGPGQGNPAGDEKPRGGPDGRGKE